MIDSVNKESEAVVMDVQVKDNQLKLFIHYVAGRRSGTSGSASAASASSAGIAIRRTRRRMAAVGKAASRSAARSN